MPQPLHEAFALLQLAPRSQQLHEVGTFIILLFREETDEVSHLPSPLAGCGDERGKAALWSVVGR